MNCLNCGHAEYEHYPTGCIRDVGCQPCGCCSFSELKTCLRCGVSTHPFAICEDCAEEEKQSDMIEAYKMTIATFKAKSKIKLTLDKQACAGLFSRCYMTYLIVTK